MKSTTSHFNKALGSRGLSVNEASKLSGVRYDTVWKHYNGMRSVSPEMTLLYEAKLGIPRSEIRPDLWQPEPAEAKEKLDA